MIDFGDVTLVYDDKQIWLDFSDVTLVYDDNTKSSILVSHFVTNSHFATAVNDNTMRS